MRTLAAATVLAGLAGGSAFGAAAAGTSADPGPSTMIVGGTTVTPQQMRTFFPGVLSYQITHPTRGTEDFHTCTGTALAPPARRLKGTAAEVAADAALDREVAAQSERFGVPVTKWVWINAHCVTNEDASAQDPDQLDMHVRIGSTDRTTGGRVIDVVKAIPHQDWAWGAVPDAPVHDAAILELAEWVRGPATVAASPGKEGLAKTAGWGLLQPEDTDVPVRLRQVDMTAPFNPQQCTGFPLVISAQEICAESALGLGHGPCFGDSGGPLTKRVGGTWQLVGSTSRGGAGDGCGTGGDIFTDVTAHAQWARYVMVHGRTPVPAPTRRGDLRAASPLDWTNAPDLWALAA